ncbi:MAG: A/G-specific adenine glycosylase [Roseivirga sp.]|jgi:A/G-specific adenine glycosylase
MGGSKVFANELINWYEQNKRELPWRDTDDPYKIWLSEIILQQTRVAQGLPYYLAFVETYPTIYELAWASETEVLRLWQGLGYYSRARNLHACAKMVVSDYGGKFPDNFDELLKLKGIGRYTAAAIASFAFGQASAVVDGNVYRVLSRVFGIEEDISSTRGPKVFEVKANELIDQGRPGTYNQAIMEFGAIQCSPKSPACGLCPFSSVCFAFNKNCIDLLPVKTKKVKVKKRYFTYLVFKLKEQYFFKERGKKDVWQGLFDFHLLETNDAFDPEQLAMRMEEGNLGNVVIGNTSKLYEHVLTHQRIFANFVQITIQESQLEKLLSFDSQLQSYTIKQIRDLPKPVLISNYLENHIF